MQGSLPLPPPSPLLLPLLLMAFLLAGVCVGPHTVLVGVPPPPNSAFLDRGTFVWGLDGEQGAFEWLAEDWGHGEGQGQERVALHWPPAGLRATPIIISGGGEEGCRSQARESAEHSTGKGGFRGQGSAGGCLQGPGRKGPPLPNREGWRGKEGTPRHMLSLCGSLRPFFNPKP